MAEGIKHICVCVCTYKRPEFLQQVLTQLQEQCTDSLFTYSIVVADNDVLQSAEAVVMHISTASSIPIKYCVEPRQNIALARNKAVDNATGDFVAFLDDDELPHKHWLLRLFEACKEYDADGVLGSARPQFDGDVPRWVVKGNFYSRPRYRTGLVLDWKKGRTGNLLLKKALFTAGEPPFRSQFRAGEDQDFFRRMIDAGHKFVFCNEAVTSEIIPAARCRRRVMIKRALLRGTSYALHPGVGSLEVMKSVIAVGIYVPALPIALTLGHHRFMSLLVRLCDHLGLLLARIGINVVKEPYVTE